MKALKPISHKDNFPIDSLPQSINFLSIQRHFVSKRDRITNSVDNNNNVVNIFYNLENKSIDQNQEMAEVIKLENGEEVRLFFTKDPELLKQYYKLREECFREEDEKFRQAHPEIKQEDSHNWDVQYDGSEDEADKNGKILVITNGINKVIAGMRLLLSDQMEYGPNEDPSTGFTIRAFLKKVGLDDMAKYSEGDDVIVDNFYRNNSLLQKIFLAGVKESERCGCKYMIGVAIKSAARVHRISFGKVRYKMDIYLNYPWIKYYPWAQDRILDYETRYPCVTYLNFC